MQGASESQVDITRLQLHCSETQRPVVLDALDSADWPIVPNHELLVLRRLEVNAESWAIGREAATQVRKLLSSAANPWSSGAEDATAVRFDNRADYLACLCREIVRPPARPRWFWRNESLAKQAMQASSAGSSLLTVLANEILLLPTVFEHLMQHGLFIDTLRCLDTDEFLTLTEHVLGQTGFAFSVSALTQQPLPVQALGMRANGIPPQHFHSWVDVLQQLTPQTAQSAASLAALLLTWEAAPQTLCRAGDAVRSVAGLRRQLLLATTATASGSIQTPPVQPADPASQTSQVGSESTPWTPGGPSRPAIMEQPAAAGDAAVTFPTPSGEPRPRRQEQVFITTQGGFFYLLNLLRMPPMQAELAASGGSAWRHLYILSRHLDEELDPALQQFLGTQLGLDHIAGLSALCADRHDSALLELANQRLAHHAFWPSALLARHARVHYDEVQLDIDFHLQSVDLDIRLSGLDVDPGWLPWLGRIVRFHYLDDPTLLNGET